MMKNHSKTVSGAYDDHSQFETDDSNSSNTENTQDSARSYTTTSRHHHQQQQPAQQQMPPEMPIADGSESGGRNLNKQPATLDLSINAPSHALSNILISRPFASFDGIGVHSGVPTRTTPTLTPTTLKNIEQTFMEATNAQINLPYQAGFVPPSYPMEDHSQDGGVSQESLSSNSNGSWAVSGSHGYTGDDHDSKSSASLEQPSSGTRSRRSATGTDENAKNETVTFAIGTGGSGTGARTGGRRNVGGRRPHKPSNLTPEEEEKRRIRRERNKQAAARCRRRREDHTNELVDETDQLEKKRQSLAQEIQQLQQEKDDLEFLLETHREHCRLQARRSPIDLKPVDLDTGGFENTGTFVLPKIKTEPEDEFAAAAAAAATQQHHQQPPPNQLQEQLAIEAAEHGTISKK